MESAKNNPLIFNEIKKQYGRRTVLDNVSGSINPQAITSLIGPNGAGKSTLLGILSRLLQQDGGRVSFYDWDIKDYNSNELAKKLSILRQANQLDLKLTIRDLVSFGRFPYCKGRLSALDWQKVDAAIAFSDLQDIQDQFVDELSGGQRQRAFIAMIIAQDTDYILLDEPLNNLDMKHSVQVMKTLRRLVEDLGKTVVLVIHEINFAAQFSDYIIALKEGRICHHDPTDRVITSPVLKDIFGIEFDIIERHNKKICNYFNL